MIYHTFRAFVVLLQTRLTLVFYFLTGKKVSLEIRGEGQFDGTYFDGISDQGLDRTLHWQCGTGGLPEMQCLAQYLVGGDFFDHTATFPDCLLNTSNRFFDETDTHQLTAFQPHLVLMYNSDDQLVLFGTIVEGVLIWMAAPRTTAVRHHLLQQQQDLLDAVLQASQSGDADRFDVEARLCHQERDIDFMIATSRCFS